jgi:hypothetical protein
MPIIEILEVNLPAEMRAHRLEDRFVAWLPGGPIGDSASYPDAVREAIALGAEGCVGFLVADEPVTTAPASKPDYSEPVPSILSRRKSKAK